MMGHPSLATSYASPPALSRARIVTSARAWSPLALVLLSGLALRVVLILSPYGGLESDEAIVGLMAMHILDGDRPVFYWGQSYLGALEAYSAAVAFAVLGSTTFALRLVPALYSMGFVWLSYLVARRLFGRGPALLTAVYLAIPPTMLAVWSIKPRGGYAELLMLGEAVLLLALALPKSRQKLPLSVGLGLVAGLAFWTNPLAIVYLLPAAAYLALAMRSEALPLVVPVLLGMGVGAAPLILDNLQSGFASLASLTTSAGAGLSDVPRNVRALWRMGLPVLGGLGQPTADLGLWLADWPSRPAGNVFVALAGDALLVCGLLPYRRPLLALLQRTQGVGTGPALLVGVFVVTLLVLPFTKFAELVAEPRYALPLYAAAPLYAALAWRFKPGRPAFVAAVALPLLLNMHNLVTADPWLLLPTTAGRSTPDTRAGLLDFLESRNLDRAYADYWLAYPLTFESQERVIVGVMSNGFNRFIPYAHMVFIAPRPAFVLISGSPEADAFYAKMRSLGAQARSEQVSIYDVVYDVSPLDPLRP